MEELESGEVRAICSSDGEEYIYKVRPWAMHDVSFFKCYSKVGDDLPCALFLV